MAIKYNLVTTYFYYISISNLDGVHFCFNKNKSNISLKVTKKVRNVTM